MRRNHDSWKRSTDFWTESVGKQWGLHFLRQERAKTSSTSEEVSRLTAFLEAMEFVNVLHVGPADGALLIGLLGWGLRALGRCAPKMGRGPHVLITLWE